MANTGDGDLRFIGKLAVYMAQPGRREIGRYAMGLSPRTPRVAWVKACLDGGPALSFALGTLRQDHS